MLVTRGNVATLLASPSPFTDDDRRGSTDSRSRFEFTVLVAPWAPPRRRAPAPHRQRRTLASSSTRPPRIRCFDFTPPTDERPFFFNMLKPRGVLLGLRRFRAAA